MTKTNNRYFWYGALATVLGSVNIPLMKYAVASSNHITLNALRFGMGALVTLPFIFKHSPKITKNNLKYAIYSGIAIFVSSSCLLIALNQSTANYVTLLMLLNPIMLMLYSVKMTKDKLDLKKIAGFSMAGIGALIIVATPFIVTNNTSLRIYPSATFYALLFTMFYPLSVVFARKASEGRKKLPLTAVVFVQAFVVTILNIGYGLLTKTIYLSPAVLQSPKLLLPVVYSGIFVTVLSRVLNIASYKKTGSAINGSLFYAGVFITLLVSIYFLQEPLSLTALIGGLITLAGVALSKYKPLTPLKSKNNPKIRR